LAGAERPNVLFIIADDQCFQTIGALGYTDIDTPNLDRLVKRGTTFTHAYNMGSFSGAVCVASRAMLISGRSVWRAKAIYEKTDQLRLTGELWPQRMERQGYATYFTGKWHITADVHKTFNVTKNVRGGMPKETPEQYNRPLASQPDSWSPDDPKFDGFWQGGRHWSEVVADDVVGYFGDSQKSKKPFFIYAAFNAPHDPRQSPRAYLDKYPMERIALPKNFLPVYPYHKEIGCDPTLRDEKLAPFPRTEHAVKVHRQEYYAIISHMDAQIGRILDALDQSGQAEKSWIIFTADHGLAVGQHGLMGKQNLYDHSMRVPFIVVGPDAPKNVRIDRPIYLQDAMATSLAIAGAEPNIQIEFQNLLPILRGEQQSRARDSIYGGYLDLQRAVIHDCWKLILYPKIGVARLYHVETDPDEIHDLAADPAQADRIRNLFQRLRRLQRDLDDPVDLAAAFPGLGVD
jgi:choline-sulfatase